LIATWAELRDLAEGLNLPEVTRAYPFGHETLKAHGKNWVYWAALTDAAVFKADKAERDFLQDLDPERYPVHPHYQPHGLILVRSGHLDPDWARARLIQTWREMAPKRWLKTWDAARDA
jgi:hypothetical protein